MVHQVGLSQEHEERVTERDACLAEGMPGQEMRTHPTDDHEAELAEASGGPNQLYGLRQGLLDVSLNLPQTGLSIVEATWRAMARHGVHAAKDQ
jgi:hypothetical protein